MVAQQPVYSEGARGILPPPQQKEEGINRSPKQTHPILKARALSKSKCVFLENKVWLCWCVCIILNVYLSLVVMCVCLRVREGELLSISLACLRQACRLHGSDGSAGGCTGQRPSL